MTRAMPTGTLGEREMIMGWLAFHRQTLEWKLEGVSADQAVARSTVSQLTLLGLVRHMTEVERGWIAEEYGGQELAPLYCRPGAPDADFDELDPAKYAQDMATWLGDRAHGPDRGRSFAGRHGAVGQPRRPVHALDPVARVRGVRPAQRARRHHPRIDRRCHRGVGNTWE